MEFSSLARSFQINFQTPTEANEERKIPPNIEFLIKRTLDNISYKNVNMFRISFFEFHPSHSTLVSTGNQISREEVGRLYNKESFPCQTSLQYELDLFYEKCLTNSVGTEIKYFFQTKLLTVDQYLTFREQFSKTEQSLYSKRLRKNKKKLSKRLMLFEQRFSDFLLDTKTCHCCGDLPANAGLQQKMYFDNYDDANHQIAEDFKLSSDLVEILKHSMFNGFRATWEFNLQEGKPTEEKIDQVIKENTWQLIYSESPHWDGWVEDICKRLIKDLESRP